MSATAVGDGPPAPVNGAAALVVVVVVGALDDEGSAAEAGDTVVAGDAEGRVVPAEASTPRGPEHAVPTTASASSDATVTRARPFALGRRVTVGWS